MSIYDQAAVITALTRRITALERAAAAHTHIAFDARTFGAVGDGTTDDTTAIQEALDTCAVLAGDIRGGYVWLPRGVYRTSAKLIVPAYVTLLGEGRNATIIRTLSGTFPTNTPIVQLGDSTIDTQAQGCRVENLQLWDESTVGSVGVFSDTVNEKAGAREVLVKAVLGGYDIRNSVASRTVTNVARSSNVATITTSSAHGLSIGDDVLMVNVSEAGYDGSQVVVAIPTSTTFTYANVGADQGTTAATGFARTGGSPKNYSLEHCQAIISGNTGSEFGYRVETPTAAKVENCTANAANTMAYGFGFDGECITSINCHVENATHGFRVGIGNFTSGVTIIGPSGPNDGATVTDLIHLTGSTTGAGDYARGVTVLGAVKNQATNAINYDEESLVWTESQIALWSQEGGALSTRTLMTNAGNGLWRPRGIVQPIVQRGNVPYTTDANGRITITFPATFPNVPDSVHATVLIPSGNEFDVHVRTVSTTQMVVELWRNGSVDASATRATGSIQWAAFGAP